MLNNQFFDQITQSLLSFLPQQAQEAQQLLKESFQSVLMQAFADLDLVSREEFDVQVKVLARTREKVTQLQQQVDALLEQLSHQKKGGPE